MILMMYTVSGLRPGQRRNEEITQCIEMPSAIYICVCEPRGSLYEFFNLASI